LPLLYTVFKVPVAVVDPVPVPLAPPVPVPVVDPGVLGPVFEVPVFIVDLPVLDPALKVPVSVVDAAAFIDAVFQIPVPVIEALFPEQARGEGSTAVTRPKITTYIKIFAFISSNFLKSVTAQVMYFNIIYCSGFDILWRDEVASPFNLYSS